MQTLFICRFWHGRILILPPGGDSLAPRGTSGERGSRGGIEPPLPGPPLPLRVRGGKFPRHHGGSAKLRPSDIQSPPFGCLRALEVVSVRELNVC